MSEKARAYLLISGKVQGVFFRENTKNIAKNLGLTGWVKNLDNGQVEAVFEGEKEKIEEIINWAKKGPVLAKVKEVKIEWQDYQREFSDFEIKYN